MARPTIVYAICNNATGEAYIGVRVDLAERWRHHRTDLRGGYHCNPALQRAWTRDGAGAHSLVVLERVDEGPSLVSQYRRNESERRWLARARAAGIALYNDQVGRWRERAA